MKVEFLSQAGKLLKEQKQYRRRLIVFLCLAVIVTYGTLTALKLYGQAMTHKVEVLDCQYEVHEHTDECYETDEEGNPGTEPVCGYADYVIHTHNDSCYDTNGSLACTLEEHPVHEHTEECYVTEKILICEEGAAEDAADSEENLPGTDAAEPEESAAAPDDAGEAVLPDGGDEAGEAEPVCGMEEHAHDESCSGQVLICTQEGHEHTVECVDGDGSIICGMEEHIHDGSCRDEEGNLICGKEEHRHIIVCYDEDGNEICGKAVHVHDGSCVDEEGNIICGSEEHEHIVRCYQEGYICETEEHTHDDTCYARSEAEEGSGEADSAEPEESAASVESQESDGASGESGESAGSESGAGATGHVHTEACYEEVTRLTCGEAELHTHDESCYAEECFDEEGSLIEGSRPSCGLLQLEEHMHAHTDGEDSCFKTVELTPEEVAALENGAKLHIHEDSCYDEEGNLICGHDATHIHVPECYDDAGELICGYGTASHVHEDKCYDEEGNLTCGYETASHVHEDSCYDEEGNLQCGYEAASHVHEDSCYDEEGDPVCGYETAKHVHDENCYDEEGNLQCGYETASHVHEDSCHDEDGDLVCGYETAAHVHEESCYDEEGNVICGYEAAAHVHEDSCYDEAGNLICGYETAAHVHKESCYDEDGNVICGYETALHAHEDSCYDEEGNLICGYNEKGLALAALYCDEQIHQHDADCYDEAGNLICGKADYVAHSHTDYCYNADGKLICPLPEVHVHSEECYPEEAEGETEDEAEGEAEPICGQEEVQLHTHTGECYDADGALICGQVEILEHVHSEACKVSSQPVTKTFENEDFIITAVYNRDANIPEKAELIAEQITEENNGEHYAKRQEEYQEVLGDDKATMRALLKIGFYVNGREVEPESPVTVTVQFLDENGLAEGRTITVIHFAEDGTEMLEGSKVEDGRTTFEIGSFSEIAVGYGVENVRVPVDAELKYETDEFEVTFRIEGEVNVPVDGMRPREEAGAEGEAAAPDSPVESEAEESGTGEDAANEEAEAGTDDTESTELPEGSESGEAEDSGDVEADVMTSENGVSVIIENSDLEKKLEFRVDPLDENAEEYAKAAAAVYADGTDGADELDDQLFLQVLSYKMLYDGKKLDLSDCTVTAEVKPSEALVEYAETAVDPETLDLDGEEQIPIDLDIKPEVVIAAVELAEDETENEIADAMVVNHETMAVPMILTLSSKADVMAIVGTSQANPEFTVQYYANLDVIAEEGNDSQKLDVIDTDNGGLNNGGNLPRNGGDAFVETTSPWGTIVKEITKPKGANTKYIYLEQDGNRYRVKTESVLKEIYTEVDYEYIKAPNILYFNRLSKNGNYELKEIWVSTIDKSASTNPNDWKIYSFRNEGESEGADITYTTVENVHFTNRQVTAENQNFILIDSNTVIRLVCDPTRKEESNQNVFFYDYDISDGKVYNAPEKKDANVLSRGANKSNPNKSGIWYIYTDRQGINSNGNTLGFGNNNTGTTMEDLQWNGNYLNRTNGKLYKDSNNKSHSDQLSFKGCTFGLVQSTDSNGHLIYAEGVNAPKLFSDGHAAGKTVYSGEAGSSLTFERKGDTYTLVKATTPGSTIADLHLFNHPGSNNHIWTNNFWPLDKVESAGKDGNDLMFGKRNQELQGFNEKGANTNGISVNDDGLDHNSFFGMQYQVDFELTEDYIGPLEYLFYGDDDMWVLLSKKDENGNYGNGTLICDIGGVHSSVGEYVNLWDWIPKGESGKGNYRLYFYYTERGAYGSSCWMQFTLPSVSFSTPKQDVGNLKIQKKVNGKTDNTEEEFGFTIKFMKDNEQLMDDYSYKKYSNGVFVENDILIWNDAKFFLKAGEYIDISYLPDGTTYIIEEIGPVKVQRDSDGNVVYDSVGNPVWTVLSNTYHPEIDGGSVSDTNQNQVTGIIGKETTVEITYNNVNMFALPETGGTGTILYTMAGGMIVLFGAGFLYKKKFRERRG